MDWFVSSNQEWAAIPFGEKVMTVYKGQQDKVFNTIEEARDYITSKSKKKNRNVSRASKIKGLEQFMN